MEDKTTVLQLVRKYIALRRGVKPTTRAGYVTVVRLLEADPFGSVPVESVKLSDAKAWLVKLQQTDGKSFTSIHTVRGVVRPAFQMAVDDDMLTKNPFDFPLLSVLIDDEGTREAITAAQEEAFLSFIRESSHFRKFYNPIYILFKTGLRISEFTGLTLSDIDMEKRLIDVNHQLQRVGTVVYASTTKTNAGTRVLPMTDDVFEAFGRILEARRTPEVEPTVDGYTGFLFIDRLGHPMVSLHWDNCFKAIRRKYDLTHSEPLPTITPHVCRHTYCSNMAKRGMNPKVLQYLMGHSDISITLNVYTHLKLDDAREELRRVGL